MTGALNTADTITTHWLKAQALCEIAVLQARKGDEHGAKDTFHRAFQESDPIGNPLRSLALEAVATAQARADDVSGALATAKRIQPDLLKARAHGKIAHAILESHGFYNEADKHLWPLEKVKARMGAKNNE
jgi:hypothetical protein